MAERGPSVGRIRFGAFEADLHSRELFRDGKRISLANQSFVALAALLEQPGRLVSREELQRRLWPDNRVVEFDQGLNAVINRLREALATEPNGAALIETLPRRGYRFVGTLHSGQVEQARKRTASPRRAIVIAIALCALAVAAAALLSRSGRTDSIGGRVEPLTSLVGREVAPAFAPDREHLLLAWNGDTASIGRFDLYIKTMGSERLTRLTHNPAAALQATWAPSGTQIVFARQTDHDSGVYLTTLSGESEHLLAPAQFLDESFMQLSWSPDGRQVAYAAIEPDRSSRIHLVSPSGSGEHALNRPADCADAGMPAFSPDGHLLAFVCTSSVAVYSVYVTEPPSGVARPLASFQGNPEGLAWIPNGETLIVANDSDTDSGLWRVSRTGQVSRLLRSEGALGPGISVAAGHIGFVRENRVIDIWRADLTSAASPDDNLISSTRSQLVPEYSPDGARVAFESTRSGSPEIWAADADGRNPVKLTSFNGPLTGAPSWCSDGRRIAFDSRASGKSALYILDVLEGRAHRVETSPEDLALPAWSQDCHWLFASNGRTIIYRVPASGGPAERFTGKRAYRPVVSGSRVIFNVSGEQGVELWSKPVEGGIESALEGMPPLRYSDSWIATPRGIYYTGSGATSSTVSFYDFTSHHVHVVKALQGPPAALGGLGISVSKDEHWLLYTRTDHSDADIVMVSYD